MAAETAHRTELVWQAQLHEQAYRYEEAFEIMKKLAKLDVELTKHEKNVFHVACRNMVTPRRNAWRVIHAIEENEELKGNVDRVRVAKEFQTTVEIELHNLCNDILGVLDHHLIPNATTVESKIFYHKMKGDHYRFIAEFAGPKPRKTAAEEGLIAYQTATEYASELLAAHPLRVGLALNFAVFFWEILELFENAVEHAYKAHTEALEDLDKLDNHLYDEAAQLMALMQDNIKLWASEMMPLEEEEQEHNEEHDSHHHEDSE